MPITGEATRLAFARLKGRALQGSAEPASDVFGFDRGTPVDRWYIERFLASHQADIRGAVLEVGETRYVTRFGAARVQRFDVLDVRADNPIATIVADLADTTALPESVYDCIIATQVLFLLFDMTAGVRSLHRMLAPGGTLLLTVPVTCRICDEEPDHWRLTSLGLRKLLEQVFEPEKVAVEARGNLATSIAFLRGLAAEEVPKRRFGHDDPRFELVALARAEKAGT